MPIIDGIGDVRIVVTEQQLVAWRHAAAREGLTISRWLQCCEMRGVDPYGVGVREPSTTLPSTPTNPK